MPHVSVTIPVFNRAHLVGKTIECILKQSFTDLDLVVVDDASQDNTVEVARQYAARDSRVRVIVNSQNLGLTKNWNKCLDLAQGPLVHIMQSDDLIDADYLQLVSDMFDQNPALGFVAATCRYIDADDRVIGTNSVIESHLYPAGDEAVTALLTGGFPHVSSIVMRRECYERLGKIDEQIWHGPDGEMDARIASQYAYYRFGDVHTSFRRHGSNMGNLEYLRQDFLQVDRFKKRKAWSYLSTKELNQLGIVDLDKYLDHDIARVALNGVIVMVAYGKANMARHYLREAIRIDPAVIREIRFWRGFALCLLPIAIARRVMEKRMKFKLEDAISTKSVEQSLRDLKTGEGKG